MNAAAAVGEAGDAADARRSIKITMLDSSYSPNTITIAKGETVRWTFGGANGAVQADSAGCITIPRLKITAEPATLGVRKAK